MHQLVEKVRKRQFVCCLCCVFQLHYLMDPSTSAPVVVFTETLSYLRCGTHISFRKERDMPSKQGDLSLLDHPIAQELLHYPVPARLAYTCKDGTPRFVPIWFHWNGEEIVLGSHPKAPKVMLLPHHPQVALTIDSTQWPYRAL